MKIDELKKAYERKKDKYDLPEFDELEKNFHLGIQTYNTRDLPDNTLHFIAAMMLEYTNSWIGFCHNLIMGNPQSMVLMQESNFFDDKAKKELSLMMARLTVMSRNQSMFMLKNDEKGTAKFIKEALKDWKGIQPSLVKYAELSHKYWQQHVKEQEMEK